MFQNLVSRCTDAKRHRCEAIINNKFRCNFTQIAINENSLTSCPPVFCSSEQAPVFVIADSEADPQSQDSCNMNKITTSNASHSPCNDIENAMQDLSFGCSGYAAL